MTDPLMEAPPPALHKSRRRRILTHLAKVAVGIVIVSYLLNRYDFVAVAGNLRTTDPVLYILAWVFGIAAMVCYAAMTRVVMGPLGMPLTTAQILKVNFQVRFFALFLPGATNFLVKWHKFSRVGKQPAQAIVVMGFTRLVHTLALMLITAVGIARDPGFPWPWMQWTAWTVAATLVIGFFFIVSRPGRRTATVLAEVTAVQRHLPLAIAKRWKKLWHIIARLEGVSPREIALLMALAIGGNILETIHHACIGQAVGLELSIWVYAWLRGIVVVAAIVPFSLSGLGVREAGVVALLIFYAVPEEQALAYSLLYFSGFVLAKGAIGGILELVDTLRGARPRPHPPHG